MLAWTLFTEDRCSSRNSGYSAQSFIHWKLPNANNRIENVFVKEKPTFIYVWLPRNNVAQIITDDGMVSYDDCFGQWSQLTMLVH